MMFMMFSGECFDVCEFVKQTIQTTLVDVI